MCGLIGVVTKWTNGFNVSTQKTFFDLLYMDTLRGPDSTGVALIDRDGNVVVAKDMGPAYEFLQTKEYAKEIDIHGYKEGKALIGHNRKATQGKISAVNAHPFTIDDEFVLAHNGTLTTHKHLGDHDVDSHAIAQYLHDNWKDSDTPEDKAKTLAHIGGAWALLWYDIRTSTYNVVRNPQRPLTIVETSTEFFIGSEEHMLVSGVTRNNNHITKTIPTVPYTVYSFKLDGFSVTLEEVALPTGPFSQPVKSYPVQTLTPTCGMGGGTEVTLSKNKFKGFMKRLIGRTIPFYVEDFVDGTGNDKQWFFYGESHELNFSHEIIGRVHDTVCEKVMDAYNCAEGTIIDATFDKVTRKAQLTVRITGTPDMSTTSKVVQ